MQILQQNLQKAFQLLQAGRAADARKLAENVTRMHPNVPDAVHLLALCCKAMGDMVAAEENFAMARDLAPKNVQIICNYANLLNALGRTDEAIVQFKSAIKIDPDFLNAQLGLGMAALNGARPKLALEAYGAVAKRHPNEPNAWHGIGSAHMALEDYPAAQKAFEKALELEPNNARAWLSLGVVERLQGNLSSATPCFIEAEKRGFVGPELEDGKATILLDQGRISECLDAYRNINRSYPQYVPAHEALVRLAWQHEPETDPLDNCREAADAQMDNVPLQMCYLRLLGEGERWQDTVERLETLRRHVELPKALPMEAVAWDGLNETAKARPLFEDCIKIYPDDPSLRIAFARHMFRSKEFEGALEQSKAAIKLDEDDQMGWAYLGTAWRLLGDEREDWLHGYDRYVQPIEVEIPAGFETREAFGMALEEALLPLHRATQEPIEQSLRKGTQTEGNLFANPEGLIKTAREQISKAVVGYYQGLPEDDSHPFLRRRTEKFRYSGSWSARLRSEGFHIIHIHSKGWISSAFYVTLPPSVDEGGKDHQGWIKFGQPPLDLGLDLEPRRYVQPKVGVLALFPSYTWHGTVPFDDDTFRMTMAFDAVPQKQ